MLLSGILLVSASLLTPGAASPALGQEKGPSAAAQAESRAEKAARKERDRARAAKSRADSMAAILSRLGLGQGSVVADVGAGSGSQTWALADIVGPTGTVLAEEITQGMVESLQVKAEEKGLAQVRPVLGRTDDPCLPANSVDMAFMRYVYHHVTQPRDMLRGIWRGLKPGGYLVIVDRHRGTLRDWVPREDRGPKHFWIAETTVVREAREEGFAFVECCDELWKESEPFVAVFQRPQALQEPGCDPDPFLPLDVEACRKLLLPEGCAFERPAIIALGQARSLIGPILDRASGEALEIVLEEWATQKEERPPLTEGVSFPSVLTESGDPQLGPEPIDAVFFLDSYHLLFHGQTLLARLGERLAPDGRIYVLDREATEPLGRREASHHRKIAVQTVTQEMSEAGFSLVSQGPKPAADRFLLVFGKSGSSAAE